MYLQNVRKILAGMNPPPPIAMNKSGPDISPDILRGVRKGGLTELRFNLYSARLDSFMDIVVAQSDPCKSAFLPQ